MAEQIEETLLQAAAGYKDTSNLRNQLIEEAKAKGYAYPEAIVDRVIARLNKTETGRKGGAFGVAHNPTNELATMVANRRF
jgi:mannitol/fructose-specific phosphotransferase system IIA component (Ntr-type)